MQETSLDEIERLRKKISTTQKGRLFLNLDDETYESFPVAVLELRDELQGLSISMSSILSIPTSIACLQQLRVLELRNNDIDQFPVSLLSLTNLEVLDLSYNDIVSIPEDIVKLHHLESLSMQNTKLDVSLAEGISSLTNLLHLDISKNSLETLPERFANLKHLERLNIWLNLFAEAPSVVTELTELKTLDISYNRLSEFVLDISKLTKLENFDLEGNQLTVFPDVVCTLTNLKRLDIGKNRIRTIPDTIKDLVHLKELWVNNNQLTFFPGVICELKSLLTLSVSYNDIKSVPNSISYLVKLKNLALDHCGLQGMVPLSICMLSRLEWLSLGNNNITKLPSVLRSNLHQLSYINLDGNEKLKEPPPSVCRRGIKSIFNYLDDKETQNTFYQKLIVLGNVKAGKSSLTKTLIQGSSQLSSDEDRTVVLDQMSWTPKGNLSLQVYDFGGSAWYDVVQHFFIDKDSIVILVINPVDYSYMDCVEKWLKIIQARAPGAKLFVVMTHTDMLTSDEVSSEKENLLRTMRDREELEMNNVKQEIKRLNESQLEARAGIDRLNKAKDNRLVLPEKIYSVSSKTMENIRQLRGDLLLKAKELGRAIPTSWYQLYDALHASKVSKKKSFLTFKDVLQMNTEDGDVFNAGIARSPRLHRRLQHPPLQMQLSANPNQNREIVTQYFRPRTYSQQYVNHPLPTQHDENTHPEPQKDSQELSASEKTKDILAFFHSIGDVLWYEGNQEIENFVFHKQVFLIDLLKRIFLESPEKLPDGVASVTRLGLTSHAMDAARKDLSRRGIMSIQLLKGMLDHLHLKNKMIDAIVQLLVQFDICFIEELQDNRITKLHFPWFLSEETPQEASSILHGPLDSDCWRFILEYAFPIGNPRALYETMSVHMHRTVHDVGGIKHWKNGVYTRKRQCKLLLHRSVDPMNIETIRLYVQGEDIRELWSLLTKQHAGFRKMIDCWPGISLEMWLICPHCTKEGAEKPHRFNGENVEKCCPEDESYVTCPNSEKLIPINLIYPVLASTNILPDDTMSQVSYMIGSDWRGLGRALGMDEYVLDGIDSDNTNIQEKACQMLQKWKQRNGLKANFECLMKALKREELQRSDIIEKLKGEF